ncbi:MAG: hypothetical protein QG614_615 [Patescibacteria group bacterium]|nr:hypothetical protein [Patescibacteria group bacterium]
MENFNNNSNGVLADLNQSNVSAINSNLSPSISNLNENALNDEFRMANGVQQPEGESLKTDKHMFQFWTIVIVAFIILIVTLLYIKGLSVYNSVSI